MKYDDRELDEAILSGLKRSEESAFTKLYNRYYRLCFYIAFKLLNHHEDAEDIVANAFMKIWINRESLPDEVTFNSYLGTIVLMIVKDNSKYKGRLKRTYKPIFPEVTTPVDTITGKQLFNRVEAELNKLGVSQQGKDIFRLYYYEDISTKEIAEANGLIQQTVKNHNHRVTIALRSKLKSLYNQNVGS